MKIRAEVLLLLLGLAGCKQQIESGDSEIKGYTNTELLDSKVQARAKEIACTMEEMGWTDAAVPLVSAYGIQTHSDLVQHFVCISNKESQFAHVQARGGDARGIFQVRPLHLGGKITYRGKEYSCPAVSYDSLRDNDKINAQCALFVYVESYARGEGLRPWDGMCNQADRQILPSSCGTPKPVCDTLKTYSRVDADKIFFTTIINATCPATKITIQDNGNVPLYSATHTIQGSSVLISKQDDGTFSAKYFMYINDLNEVSLKSFKTISYKNDTKFLSNIVTVPQASISKDGSLN